MAIIIKSNSIATNSLGNINGLGDFQDFRFLVDFETGETVIKENGVTTKETLSNSINFSRASTANYTSKGVDKIANANEFRLHTMPNGDTGLLLEPEVTNLLLNPLYPADQTVDLAFGSDIYILSVYGSGSVSISGNVTELSNSNATEQTPVAFKVTNSGNGRSYVNLTVTGNLTKYQLEKRSVTSSNAFAGVPSPTTFTEGTRKVESAQLSAFLNGKLSQNFTVIASVTNHKVIKNLGSSTVFKASDTTQPDGQALIRFDAGKTAMTGYIVDKNKTASTESLNFLIGLFERATIVFTHDVESSKLAINAASKTTNSGHDIGTINLISFSSTLCGIIRKIAVFNRKLTDDELIKASTLLI